MSLPEQIGRYQIQSELGRGGLAVVYRATDIRSGQDVALKVLPQQFMSGPTFRARFESDAKAIANLKHPAIVPILDHGEDNVRFFYAMPYLTGGALPSRIAEGRLPLAEATRIFQRIASGLSHAHQQDVIHRNFRAGSVLFDADNQPHISDFGIVTLPEVASDVPPHVVMQSLPYLAPEQLRREAVDHRADIYALGVLLYEMLAGHRPFRADTPQEMAGLHLTAPVPPLPQDIPAAEVADIVLARAMAKQPEDRFASADELAGAWANATSQPAIESTPSVSTQTSSGGNALFAILVAGLALAALVLGLLVLNPFGLLLFGRGGDTRALTQTHTASALGFSIDLPGGWLAQDVSSFGLLGGGVFVTVAGEDQAAFDSLLTAIDDGDMQLNGPVLVGMTIDLDLGEESPLPFVPFGARAALQLMKEDTPMANERFTRTRNTRVGERPAAWTDFTAEDPSTGTPLAGRIVSVTWSDQVGIFIGAAPASDWESYAPTFDAMLDTVELFEPSGEAPSLFNVESSFGLDPSVDSQGEFTGGDGYQTSAVWAVPLNQGQPTQWDLPDGAFADNWKFDGTSGWPVTITVRALDSGFDPYVTLIDPDGFALGYDDDSGGGQWGYDSQLHITLPATGKYVVRVTSYDREGGSYSIEVTSP